MFDKRTQFYTIIRQMPIKQPIGGSAANQYGPDRELKALSKRGWRIVRAIAERIYPPGGGISYGADDIDLVYFLDEYLGDMPKENSFFLKIFFYIFEFMPLFMIGKLSLFTSLSVADQNRYLKAWEESRIYYFRMALTLLKTLCAFGYFTDERVREEMGFYVVCKASLKLDTMFPL